MEEYNGGNLKRFRINKFVRRTVSLGLSCLVALGVFSGLRQTGIALVGDADCGIEEHMHDEKCAVKTLVCSVVADGHGHSSDCYGVSYVCGKEEHTHGVECYSDPKADAETQLDWQEAFGGYCTGDLSRDVAALANSQVGYKESRRNFNVDANGERHGYTRYGAWYGAPYCEWSAAFVSFCLNYAGADPDVTPFNIGANAMASAWSAAGRYAARDEYAPHTGDLAFFSDNTVGIVTEIYGHTAHIVKGDVDDSVVTTKVLVTDLCIVGWGLTSGTKSADSCSVDVSKEPKVYIYASFAGDRAKGIYRLGARASTDTSSVNIKDYVYENNGTFTLTLLNTDDTALPKDENGNYIVTAEQDYKLTLGIHLPNGIHPGTYTYRLPSGLTVVDGRGDFIVDDKGEKVKLGTWTIDDDGLITFVMDEKANDYTDVTISATMGVSFDESEGGTSFDDGTGVTVKPPQEESEERDLRKNGQGVKTDSSGNVVDKNGNPIDHVGSNAYVSLGDGFDRVRWNVTVWGKNLNGVTGKELCDTIVSGNNLYYSAKDMELGIYFNYTAPDGTQHNWIVSKDDPGLTWTESGWTYVLPSTAHCRRHDNDITLSDEGKYTIIYYSTVKRDALTEGDNGYQNKFGIDGKTVTGSTVEYIAVDNSGIVKNGRFDATKGIFHWSITATLDGSDGKTHKWKIMDGQRIVFPDFSSVYVDTSRYYDEIENFTITYDGKTEKVYPLADAPQDATFVYYIVASADGSCIDFYLGKKCTCSEETCMNWSKIKGCMNYVPFSSATAVSGFCRCWDLPGTAVVQIDYTRDAKDLIDAYGALNCQYRNTVTLIKSTKDANGNTVNTDVDKISSSLTIPDVLKKELKKLPSQANDYTASYLVTLNESLVDLRGHKDLTIEDKMSSTLGYISGTMVVTEIAADGTSRILTLDRDYTLVYDADTHTLTVVISAPGACKYTLAYDARIVIPSGVTTVDYSNSATVTLFGKKFSKTDSGHKLADINIAARSYSVQIVKTEGDSGKNLPLIGAHFGLYAANGELVIKGVTDSDGKLVFRSNITAGIILREHVLYYIREIAAPDGYRTDKTEYWFCFCNGAESSCEVCSHLTADKGAFRIPYEETGTVSAVNYVAHYKLPATGGAGCALPILCGTVLVAVPVACLVIRRRRKTRGAR